MKTNCSRNLAVRGRRALRHTYLEEDEGHDRISLTSRAPRSYINECLCYSFDI